MTDDRRTLLEARGVEFGYEEGRRVLGPLDIAVGESDFTVVLGPNGAGKSTLLRVLAGTVEPWSGSVRAGDAELGRLAPRERARRLAVVPQSLARVPRVTVERFVESGRYAHVGAFGRPSSEDRSAVERALVEVELAERRDDPLDELSGGQLQRALVGRALAQEPRVLLVDEPTSSLDLSHQLSIFQLIAGLTCVGRGVLCVTHDLNLASQFATRLCLLDEGRLVADGDAAEVLRPEVLGPVYGEQLRFGSLPAPHGEGQRPWVLPWSTR